MRGAKSPATDSGVAGSLELEGISAAPFFSADLEASIGINADERQASASLRRNSHEFRYL